MYNHFKKNALSGSVSDINVPILYLLFDRINLIHSNWKHVNVYVCDRHDTSNQRSRWHGKGIALYMSETVSLGTHLKHVHRKGCDIRVGKMSVSCMTISHPADSLTGVTHGSKQTLHNTLRQEPGGLTSMKESCLLYRLYPAASMVYREAVHNDYINGYFIPAGTILNVNIGALHR